MRPPSGERAHTRTKRTWIALSVLVIVALLAFFVWTPVQNRVTAAALWHGETLDESAFRDLLEKTPDRLELLRRTWDIRRIPHRRAVMTCLPELLKQDLAKLEPI